MTTVIETINSYKHKSAELLKNQQVAYIPTVDSDQIEFITPSFLIDGKRTLVNQTTQICFKLRYLKFKPMQARKSIKYKNGIWKIEDLVKNNVIQPFMLFINGYFVPWELISLAIGQENYYLLMDSSSNPLYTSLIRNIKYAQTILLPDHVVYERYSVMDNDTLFCFDDIGRFNSSCVYAFKNDTNMHHIMFRYWSVNSTWVNAFRMFENTKTDLKLTKENIILFKNGMLASGDKNNIKRAYDSSYKDEETGRVNPCLEIVSTDYELQENPNIKIDSTLLTIGDVNDTGVVRFDIGLFANYEYTSTADNIFNTSVSGLAPLIEAQNRGESDPQYLRELQIPFEMKMDRAKPYDENVIDAIKTMISYNTSFFNSVYKEKSNLVIEEYTGEWALSNTDENGILTIPRQHSSMIDEYIIMLVNGSLYQYYYMAKHVANKYKVPIQSISYDDNIELLRFQNVNNGVMDIIVNENEGFKRISSEIINEDMILFSSETDQDNFDYPADGIQHFPVEYELEMDEIKGAKITLSNPFYYGKPLKVAYKNRYKHFWFILSETTDSYTVNLGDKFMYCNDYSKYLVFYNGRRLGSDHFRLTLPVRPTTPFYDFNIYLTMPIQEGDRLDVIYVPSLMQDIVMIPEAPTSGDIVIDKSLLNNGLSTDLYMVWINGKKIPASHIKDIDSTHIRIISNEDSTQTVCITKYIPDIDIITSIFKDNEALWDKIISQLTNEEIYTLLGINGEVLANTEADIYENAINIRAIMYELIREQFVMNPRVDVTGPFLYDYQDVDQTAIEGYDDGNNAILPVADSNRTDNLDYVERPWP